MKANFIFAKNYVCEIQSRDLQFQILHDLQFLDYTTRCTQIGNNSMNLYLLKPKITLVNLRWGFSEKFAHFQSGVFSRWTPPLQIPAQQTNSSLPCASACRPLGRQPARRALFSTFLRFRTAYAFEPFFIRLFSVLLISVCFFPSSNVCSAEKEALIGVLNQINL